jgi:hypothetical protein
MPDSSFGGETVSDGHLRTEVWQSLGQMPRKIGITQGSRSGEIKVSWVDIASQRAKSYGLDLKCRITLHRERTCKGKKEKEFLVPESELSPPGLNISRLHCSYRLPVRVILTSRIHS